MSETWYVLETGAFADPNECAPDAAGVLRHVSGVAVAVGPHGHRSRGMSQAEIAAARAVAIEQANADPPATAEQQATADESAPAQKPRRGRQMTADGGAPYETR